MNYRSKLPNVGTTIFATMSALANKHKAINLSQGFPNFDGPDQLKELAFKHMKEGKNQYAPMPGLPLLRQRLARKINDLYGHTVNPDTEITITAGATQALYTAINTFVHPGEEVIVIEPAFDSYAPSILMAGGVPVAYQMNGPDYKVDWEQLASLITDKTRMIITNTPQNPTGKTLKKEDLQALEKLVAGRDILVLSDEVYEHLIFDGQKHQSVFLYPNLWKQSLAVFSFGKTFHSTGWKIGYIVAPEPLMAEFRKVHQYNIYAVNSFLQHALADYLENENFYLNLPQFYQQKRDFFAEAMKGSSLQPQLSEGTYFQLFDYSAVSRESDTDFAIRMTTDFGVAAIPVSVFNSSGHDDHLIRLCFAKTEEVLEKAGNVLRNI